MVACLKYCLWHREDKVCSGRLYAGNKNVYPLTSLKKNQFLSACSAWSTLKLS